MDIIKCWVLCGIIFYEIIKLQFNIIYLFEIVKYKMKEINDNMKNNIFGNTNNKSIFSYVTEAAKFQNKNECANYTPPFIGYIPIGVPGRSTDVDSVLKGMNQYMSKCTEYKYRQEDNLNIDYKKNEKECSDDFNILPSGYMPFDKFKKNDK